MESIINNYLGDVLVSAGYIAYLGPFTVRSSDFSVYIIVESTIEMISYYPMLNIGHCVYSLINSMKNIFYTDLLLLFSIVGKV